MNASFDRHFPEIVWEAYALGKLSEGECASMEEHLLLCPLCQDLLAEWDEYINVIKTAATLATREDSGAKSLISDNKTRRHLSKGAMAAISA